MAETLKQKVNRLEKELYNLKSINEFGTVAKRKSKHIHIPNLIYGWFLLLVVEGGLIYQTYCLWQKGDNGAMAFSSLGIVASPFLIYILVDIFNYMKDM